MNEHNKIDWKKPVIVYDLKTHEMFVPSVLSERFYTPRYRDKYCVALQIHGHNESEDRVLLCNNIGQNDAGFIIRNMTFHQMRLGLISGFLNRNKLPREMFNEFMILALNLTRVEHGIPDREGYQFEPGMFRYTTGTQSSFEGSSEPLELDENWVDPNGGQPIDVPGTES